MELSVVESSRFDPSAATSDGGRFVESKDGSFPNVARLTSEVAHREKGVLIVEDERLLRRSLVEGFKQRGFKVWAAADGGEGVELYQKHWQEIDITLSDVQMPVLDGPRMFEVLRQINADVRLCFMTGDSRGKRCADLLRLGAVRVFSKPFSSVADVVNEMWDIADADPESAAHSGAFCVEAVPQCSVELTLLISTSEVPNLGTWLSATFKKASSWLSSAVLPKRSRRKPDITRPANHSSDHLTIPQ